MRFVEVFLLYSPCTAYSFPETQLGRSIAVLVTLLPAVAMSSVFSKCLARQG